MKNLFTSFIFILVSLSVYSQNSSIVSNEINFTGLNANDAAYFKDLVSEIISHKDFKYRAFLKQSKISNQRFQVGKEIFTKTNLLKLMRRGALKTENIGEFENYLFDEHITRANQLSREQLHSIYHVLRKGSFEKYLDDLSCCL